MVAAAAPALAGCQPPPPPGWVPPVVTATVTPEPVVAGEPFTVDVTATDVTSVTGISLAIQPPPGVSPTTDVYSSTNCVGGPFTPGPAADRSFACVLPAYAPNGTWHLTASAGSAGGGGYQGNTTTTFELVGGSDDHQAPALESVEISPNPVVIGQPFSVTLRASDDHHAVPAPTSLSANIVLPEPPEGTVAWTCPPVTPSPMGETVLEWRFVDCSIPAGSTAWTHAGGIRVEDALGYYQRLSFSFQAVEA